MGTFPDGHGDGHGVRTSAESGGGVEPDGGASRPDRGPTGARSAAKDRSALPIPDRLFTGLVTY